MGKKLEDRRISAKEAKEIADNSKVILARIYKVIRDEAEEGRIRIDWSTDFLSKKCLNNITEILKADGFIVTHENHVLTIQW